MMSASLPSVCWRTLAQSTQRQFGRPRLSSRRAWPTASQWRNGGATIWTRSVKAQGSFH
jgi:hypothetical protein